MNDSTLHKVTVTQNKVTMKSIALVSSVLFLYSASLAQGTSHHSPASPTSPPTKTEVKQEQRFEQGDLKGPRAKNHPTHAYRSSPVKVVAPTETAEKRMGPAAKNYRPWQDDTKTQHVVVTKKEKKNLKGPRAKNRKPWDNK